MENGSRNNFAIIIPAYNEADRISSTIAGIGEFTDADIIVVSDGSTDATASEAEQAGALVIRLPFNLGYGAALQTGYKYALSQGYDFAVQMDADGQHDPSYILPLIKEVQSGATDIAIGSRFIEVSGYKTTFFKRIGIAFFRTIVSMVTGKHVTDPTSGFQALNRETLKFYASEAYPVDFPDADVLIMLHKKKLRFREIPVQMKQSTKQKTMHSGTVPFYYVFKMVLSIFVTLLRKN